MSRPSMIFLCFSLLLAPALLAQDKKEDKKVDEPKTDPDLELKLVSKKESYKVPAEWRDGKLKDKLAVDAFPKPPEVDLELQITNKSKSDKTIRLESDAGRVELILKGPGAVDAKGRRFFTREFRIGKEVTIEPGETHTIPWKELSSGFRGVEVSHYWTEPGEYTLAAKLIYPLDAEKPEKRQLASEPIKLKLE